MPGPQGEPGEQGEAGPQGEQGPVGPSGHRCVWTFSGIASEFDLPTSTDTIAAGDTTVPPAAEVSISSLDPRCDVGYAVRLRGGGIGAGGIFWDFFFDPTGSMWSSRQGSEELNDSGMARPLIVTTGCESIDGPVFDYSFGVSGTFTFAVKRNFS